MSKRLFQGHLVQDLLGQSQTSLWDGKGLITQLWKWSGENISSLKIRIDIDTLV